MNNPSEKKDIYNSKKIFDKWKENASKKGIEGLNKINSKLLLDYIIDASEGKNQSRHKTVQPITLNPKINRLKIIFTLLENQGVNNIAKVREKQIHDCFNSIKSGRADKIKDFKAFFHWLMKVQRKTYILSNNKKGKIMIDVTEELSDDEKEPDFVYFTLEDLKKVQPYLSEDEQVRNLFMFDTIIRTGMELQNIKVNDCHNDFSELTIRDEIAKTYGRTIKLMLCSEELKKYVERNKLKPEDYLFEFDSSNYNKKLKIVFEQIFGDGNTKGGDYYKNISLYDFRHSGSIFWRLGSYNQKIDALMYRGGWENLSMLNYYTKKIGMKDSIEKSDLLLEVDKNEFDKLKIRFSVMEKENLELKNHIEDLDNNFEDNFDKKFDEKIKLLFKRNPITNKDELVIEKNESGRPNIEILESLKDLT